MTTGIGQNRHSLLSFDNALFDANISGYNLVKVSSILPADCTEMVDIDLSYGSILYTAYASLTHKPNKLFSSAVAVGVPVLKSDIGVILAMIFLTMK